MYDCNPVRGGMEGGMETGIQRKCSNNKLIIFIHFTADTLT